MMATDVYVETSINAPQEKKRKWGDVLEAPGGRTVSWNSREQNLCG